MFMKGSICSRVEPFDCAVVIFFRDYRAVCFPLLPACHFVGFDTSVICHVLIICFGSILLQNKI